MRFICPDCSETTEIEQDDPPICENCGQFCTITLDDYIDDSMMIEHMLQPARLDC